MSYWTQPPESLFASLGSGPRGLSSEEAGRRSRQFGANHLRPRAEITRWRVFLNQLRNPLLAILFVAAAVSAATGEWTDSAIVSTIVVATIALTFAREYRAERAAEALNARIHVRVRVWRDGALAVRPIDDLVPGDVVQVTAGALVPADGIILQATDLFVSESALTGESFPVAKAPGVAAADASLRERTNCLFLGTNVRSGSAECLIVRTGSATEFGGIAATLNLAAPETEFDRGLRRFGVFLTLVMVVMLALVFSIHIRLGRPVIDTLLFAIALAVGLSPELLPAILSVNLARAAQTMAARGVLVRRLNAIENLGSLDVLCTDKTGTLTEGMVRLEGSYDQHGRPDPRPLTDAAVNARLGTGLASAIDDAIIAAATSDEIRVAKVAEIPFDFVRKRVSVVVDDGPRRRLMTKGALAAVLEVCRCNADGTAMSADDRAAIERQYEAWTREGTRVVAVAERSLDATDTIDRHAERDLVFTGFLNFSDRPKADAASAIATMKSLGVAVKIISGDSRAVCEHVAGEVGLMPVRVLSGAEVHALDDPALCRRASETDVFAEVDPIQKERIIRALRRAGHVVGFLGDGVNDAPAMHAADTSLAVDGAVDVARAAADFVLLERDLDVIRRGIEDGRRTFANTLKYVLLTMSANLGNMISMALASLLLPFLPLLPGQILLNNFLSDIPAVGLADDAVDPELVVRPRRWNIRFIALFMAVFGAFSSLFDFVTFAALMRLAPAPATFRTGWFVESLLTELLVVFVIRTRRPFFRSRPGRVLALSSLALAGVAVVLPYVPGIDALGMTPLPAITLFVLLAITAAYVVATEVLKRVFYA